MTFAQSWKFLPTEERNLIKVASTLYFFFFFFSDKLFFSLFSVLILRTATQTSFMIGSQTDNDGCLGTQNENTARFGSFELCDRVCCRHVFTYIEQLQQQQKQQYRNHLLFN